MKNKSRKTAFTLVELIVWITISIILMVSVWVFVGSGIKSITLQEKIIEDGAKILDWAKSIEIIFSRVDSNVSPLLFSSWVLLKTWKDFDNWGFTILKELELDEFYCDSLSEDTKTNHILIKNFIPFEEEGEDITSSFELALTWSFWGYISDQKNHVVKNSSWDIIIWKWIFWDKFTEWDYWTWIYLNSPTWLALNWNTLFVSDTLNSRILAYNTSSKKIYKLLDRIDGLFEPTGLYYDNSEKALYISNSWKWEILKYSSKSLSGPDNLDISFLSQSNIDKVSIVFSWANTPSIALSSYNKSNFTFTPISSSEDFLIWSKNNLNYYFVNYSWGDTFLWECIWKSSWDIVLSSEDKPIKCSSSWTWQTSSRQYYNLSDIEVSNIIWSIGTWSYFVNLSLFRNNYKVFDDNFSYLVNGDDDLLTKDDNVLEVFTWWLGYPTGIWYDWTIKYNEFLKTWRNLSFSNITYDKYSDHILNNPISNFDLDYSNNLLTLQLSYYKVYNCYNPDEKVEKEFIFKKSF